MVSIAMLRLSCSRRKAPRVLATDGRRERRGGATELERNLVPPGPRLGTALASAVGLAGNLDPKERVHQWMAGIRRRRDAKRLAARVAPCGGGAQAVATRVDDEVLATKETRDALAVRYAERVGQIVGDVERKAVGRGDVGLLEPRRH